MLSDYDDDNTFVRYQVLFPKSPTSSILGVGAISRWNSFRKLSDTNFVLQTCSLLLNSFCFMSKTCPAPSHHYS